MYLFWHDLRRLARRGQPALGRFALGLVLLIALALSFSRAFPGLRFDQLATTYVSNRQGIQEFGIQFVVVIASFQLVAIVAFTPLLCGGALAVERVRGTLDLLRISQASPANIVFGKFAARFVYLGSYLALGLPVCAFAQLWGEIDLSMIAGCFVINVYVLTASIGLSLWCSAEVKNVPAGIAISYVAIGFFAIALLFLPWFNPTSLFDDWRRGRVVSLKGLVFGGAWFFIPLTAISLYGAWRRLARDGEEIEPGFVPMSGSRAAPPAELDARLLKPIDVRRFGILHRPIEKLLPGAAALRVLPTPRVREHPMLWKELYFGGNALAGELLRTAALGVILIELLVGAVLLVQLMTNPHAANPMSRQWHNTFQSLSVNALLAAMLSVTAFAAGSITLERDQKTLDGLLSLPQGRPAIFFTKWLGSILRVRWVVVVAILPLIAGLSIGAFHGLPIAVLSVATLVHLAFAASLGVLCSVIFTSTGRAIFFAVAALLVIAVLPIFSNEPAHDALSPIQIWRTLLRRSAAQYPETAVIDILPALAAYAASTGLLLALAVCWFDRKRT